MAAGRAGRARPGTGATAAGGAGGPPGAFVCELAVQTTAGWFVMPAIEACADPPASHDGDLPAPQVSAFRAARDAGGDMLVLAWKEQRKVAREIRCTASADGAPGCTAGKPE